MFTSVGRYLLPLYARSSCRLHEPYQLFIKWPLLECIECAGGRFACKRKIEALIEAPSCPSHPQLPPRNGPPPILLSFSALRRVRPDVLIDSLQAAASQTCTVPADLVAAFKKFKTSKNSANSAYISTFIRDIYVALVPQPTLFFVPCSEDRQGLPGSCSGSAAGEHSVR
jgi:hypothetical protein